MSREEKSCQVPPIVVTEVKICSVPEKDRWRQGMLQQGSFESGHVSGTSVPPEAVSPQRSFRSTSPRGRHWDIPRRSDGGQTALNRRKSEGSSSPLSRPGIWSSRRGFSVELDDEPSGDDSSQRSRPSTPTLSMIQPSKPQPLRRRVSISEDGSAGFEYSQEEDLGRTEEEEEDYMRQMSKDVCEASADGDLEWLMLIVQSGVSVNESDYDRRCFLRKAVYFP